MSSATVAGDAVPASTDPRFERSLDSPSVPPSPSLDRMDLSPSADPALPQSAPQSQPMTATASTSSEHPPQNNADGSAATTYGTRSRNRTSGIRINYADDKDIDLEIEAAGKYSKNTKKSG